MLRNLKQLPKVVKACTLTALPIGACMFHFSKPLKKPDNFLNDLNSAYLERMYNSWVKDKKSVEPSWATFFSNVIDKYPQESNPASSPTLTQETPTISPQTDTQSSVNVQQAIADSMKVFRLVKAYQRRGHELADLDPLRIPKDQEQSGFRKSRNPQVELDYKYYGFSEADLDREFYLNTETYSGFLRKKQTWKLGELIENLKMVYCGKAGFEYFHISDLNERAWLRERIEELPFKNVSKEKKLTILKRLCKNDCLATFLRQKFPTTTRFSLDGCDTVISGLKAMVYKASDLDVKRMVFGMAHRGRLNTLTEIIGKTYEELMCEFQDNKPREEHEISWGNSGDVKYHLGTTSDYMLSNGKTMRLSMLPNPAHLEAVGPLVQGKARAMQDYYKETSRDKTIAVSIHGDAGFSAQGIVYETFQMYDLEDFRVGGTVHVVIDNQIGFTTTEKEGRSGLYCTEIGKAGEAPIFHVNADEPELVDQIFELALDYRLKFQKNVIVDLIGYRRYGHNEVDQPAFTQPLMYKIVANTKPILQKYSEKLIQDGVISQEDFQLQITQYNKRLEEAFEKSKTQKFEQGKWIVKPTEDVVESTKHGTPRDTGVNVDLLKDIGRKITTIPPEVTPHPQLKKIYDARRKTIEQGKGIDWATAESLAFATLALDGYGVRLSGEDVERGTFSQRHAVVFDQVKDFKYVPIQQLLPEEDRHLVNFANSPLCEFGVSGFEYGHSLAHPNILCLWEAQFGDFGNEAQVIIDNFIAAGESKWGGQSGIVMLLPHGYDGQGPDHSSARLERFLELSDDDPFSIPTQEEYESDKDLAFRLFNIQVCVPTTPANYFHLLRRQLRRSFRKPLIVMTPKKLLRHRLATSELEEFKQGYRFRRIYSEKHPEEVNEPKKVRKVICCSGQVYYELLEMRRVNKIKDTAIVRFEQLAPFPYDQVRQVCLNYPNAKLVWCQEEPFNMGAWSFVQPRFNKILEEFNKRNIVYTGRRPAPATAVGSPKLHFEEVEKFINEVFEI